MEVEGVQTVKRRTKVNWVLVYLAAAILGLMIAIGVAGAVGLWPEGWRF